MRVSESGSQLTRVREGSPLGYRPQGNAAVKVKDWWERDLRETVNPQSSGWHGSLVLERGPYRL